MAKTLPDEPISFVAMPDRSPDVHTVCRIRPRVHRLDAPTQPLIVQIVEPEEAAEHIATLTSDKKRSALDDIRARAPRKRKPR